MRAIPVPGTDRSAATSTMPAWSSARCEPAAPYAMARLDLQERRGDEPEFVKPTGTGLHLAFANAINNAGQIIGVAMDAQGRYHGSC